MFKKTAIALALVVSLSGFTACQQQALTYTVNTSFIASELPNIETYITDAVFISKDNLTADEQIRILELYSKAEDLIRIVKVHTENSDGVEKLVGLAQVGSLVDQARSIYYEAYSIIAPHYNELTEYNKYRLRVIQSKFEALDNSWTIVTTSNEGTDLTAIIADILVITKAVMVVVAVL